MQIAKIVKAEVEETDNGSKSTPTSTTSPTFLHNQSPKVPLVLSTVFPSFDGVVLQSGWQSISGITPQMPTPLGGFKTSDHKLESSVMMNNPGTPLYIVSFPCQMQFHAQSNPFHPWHSSYPNDQHQTSLVHDCSTSTSKTTVNMENHQNATTLKVETKTPDSIFTMPRNFLHEADWDFLCASEGSRQLSGLRSKGLVKVTSTSSPFVLPVIARQNESSQQNTTPDVKVTYSAVGRLAGAPTEMHQECITCTNNASADAIYSSRGP